MGTETPKESKAGETPVAVSDVLKEVVKNLKGQPLLLFLLGAGLLFVMAGSMVEPLEAVLEPLGIIIIVGIIIWGFLETRKAQQGRIKGGDIKIGRGVKAKDVEAQLGDISVTKDTVDVVGGTINIGAKADLKGVKIQGGGIKIDNTQGQSQSRKKEKKKT